ncbi:hypothetical protein DFP72DRAFT_839199 [Ephemerocybe angulata]|uniref:Uncharacterized protein n=1 Tax=Ephemerocybe angulata TaxID=980116 RepID=A0A8H6IGR3_9AGAR|nr:hypothetical protein DFP72DRAFT_839199 [Tulosesus angulatus]
MTLNIPHGASRSMGITWKGPSRTFLGKISIWLGLSAQAQTRSCLGASSSSLASPFLRLQVVLGLVTALDYRWVELGEGGTSWIEGVREGFACLAQSMATPAVFPAKHPFSAHCIPNNLIEEPSLTCTRRAKRRRVLMTFIPESVKPARRSYSKFHRMGAQSSILFAVPRAGLELLAGVGMLYVTIDSDPRRADGRDAERDAIGFEGEWEGGYNLSRASIYGPLFCPATWSASDRSWSVLSAPYPVYSRPELQRRTLAPKKDGGLSLARVLIHPGLRFGSAERGWISQVHCPTLSCEPAYPMLLAERMCWTSFIVVTDEGTRTASPRSRYPISSLQKQYMAFEGSKVQPEDVVQGVCIVTASFTHVARLSAHILYQILKAVIFISYYVVSHHDPPALLSEDMKG